MTEISTGLLFLTDGMAIVASFLMSQYFARQRDKRVIFGLYVFFSIICGLFLITTFEDLLILLGNPVFLTDSYRGLLFRSPVTLLLLWMVHRSYGPGA